MDLEAIVSDELRDDTRAFSFDWFNLHTSSDGEPMAHVKVTLPDGNQMTGHGTGDGSIDAIFAAINNATGVQAKLAEYRVEAVTSGQDAIGEVSVVIELDGRTAAGQGVSTDTVQASGRAYARALTNAERHRGVVDEAKGTAASEVASSPVVP